MLQFEHFLSSFLFLQGIGKTSCAWFSSLFLLENLNTSTGEQYDQIGRFLKLRSKNILSQIAQIFSEVLGYFKITF